MRARVLLPRRSYSADESSSLASRSCVSHLAAPPQLLTFPLYGPFVDERIARVNVYQVMSSFNNGHYQVIRKRRAREILVAPGESF
jgi:hypothetical protein